MPPEILAVLGFILTALLALNAHFIKSLVDSINDVKVHLAQFIERSNHTAERVSKIEESRSDDKERILPIIEEACRRISLMEAEIKEIEDLRKAKHRHANMLTAHELRISNIEHK